MPNDRRKALLESASGNDFIIVEDDYELEANYVGQPQAALKSLDGEDRVIYLGSFSKTLFPGLRLGFVVASAELIAEMRALRRLMVRHPPTNNQRSAAFFLSLGYYDVFVRKLHRAYRERWAEMGRALEDFLPAAQSVRGMGGSSYWVQMNEGVNTDILARKALADGILIEPGSVYFAGGQNSSTFRMGFSSIPTGKISPGIERLSKLVPA